ncbi:recombinase RecT [Salmonella enterica subsp. enterica]|nr:recombinase RecT [Salmonella enterica subsp. enterica serovar Ona]EED9366265.1 recombinase RecT [Salmonella enterica subsp. enterica serovar Ituri]EIS0683778.1 recombinase RecT [Salmonella enterica]EJG7296719.1 recombinase RecT [Salmonella enterica]EJH2090134.1 recombinase RecT [Salmonella enterica]
MSTLTAVSVTDSNVAIFDASYLEAVSHFGQLMAQGVATVPAHLQGNAADCMAVAMQAAQWKMSPFAVAQKTHLINGVLGYESQLVNAVVTRSGALSSRFMYEWFGPWDRVIGKFSIRKNDKGKEYRAPAWSLADEEGCGIIVRATLTGESAPRELRLLLAQARTRNSGLWADDPKQQLAYLAVKRWARLYAPDVILGVYTPDELEEPAAVREIEINPAPAPQRVEINDIAEDVPTAAEEKPEASAADLASSLRARIDATPTAEVAQQLRAEIEANKTVLGFALFTELKNKAVKKYFITDARARIDAAINSLPPAGSDGAAQHFAEVEQVLQAARRHLGEELYAGYALTLDGLRPEYVGQ